MISRDKVKPIKKLINLLNKSLIHDITIEYWSEAEQSWKPFEIKEAYRIKPKHKRYCNGVVLSPCIEIKPELGTGYFTPRGGLFNPDQGYLSHRYDKHVWNDSDKDNYFLERGLAYAIAHEAIRHAQAMEIVTLAIPPAEDKNDDHD